MDNRGNPNNRTINNSINTHMVDTDEGLKSSGRDRDAFKTLLPGRHEKSDVRPLTQPQINNNNNRNQNTI